MPDTPARRPGKNPHTGKEQGSLLAGGKPGNKGGGRTPNEIRALAQQLGHDILKRFKERLKQPQEMSSQEWRQWLDVLLKYSIGTKIEHEFVDQGVLERFLKVTASFIPPDKREEWLSLLEMEAPQAESE